jgi:hypothetical protein
VRRAAAKGHRKDQNNRKDQEDRKDPKDGKDQEGRKERDDVVFRPAVPLADSHSGFIIRAPPLIDQSRNSTRMM